MKGSQSLAPTQSEYKIPKSCPFPSSSILVLQCALNALAKREESAGPGRPGGGDPSKVGAIHVNSVCVRGRRQT